MKNLFTVVIAVILTASAFSQAPQGLSYQAVIRNSSNELVVSSPIGIKISILQGSVSGTIIYQEIFNPNPTTNANGLITIEIGSGIPLKGTIASINWANSPFFIEIQTDPTGGTNYAITGASQILSVPYALYANTADSINGGFVEKEPAFNSSLAKNITASDTTKWNNFNTSVANAITVSDTIKWTASIHKIGDSYGGGIVFYVDATGQHGLIAAIADQSTGIAWSNGTYRTTGAMSDGAGAGELNTAIIVASQIADNQSGSFAALICAQYSTTQNGITYGNWYLPSKYELNLLYNQRAVVGGFSNNNYWSSSEFSNFNAWYQAFYDGSQDYFNKLYPGNVRAVRAF